MTCTSDIVVVFSMFRYHFVWENIGLTSRRTNNKGVLVGGRLDNSEVSGGQKSGLNISLDPSIMKIGVSRRLESGIHHPLVQNR